MIRRVAVNVVLLLLVFSGCSPIKNCHRMSMRTEWFQGANWYTIDYLDTRGKKCAVITKRSTWDGFMVLVGPHNRWVNQDRSYSLEEAERMIESKYCEVRR